MTPNPPRAGSTDGQRTSALQLNLFQWDLIEAGNGCACLARLEFARAGEHFHRVLTAYPEHPVAAPGLQAVGFWEQTCREVEGMEGEAACRLLWNRIKGFAFADSEPGRALRAGLIRQLLSLMEAAELPYITPDLCCGHLYLQLGEYVEAESRLRRLIETRPAQAALYGYLADSLWLQGRTEIAGGIYATALLLDPDRCGDFGQCHPQLTALITEFGAELAPVYGYFQGVLPLVEWEEWSGTPTQRIYALLQRAERARHRRDHATAVAARRELQQSAPEVFRDYLEHTRSAPRDEPN